jgi:signal transduction histidine kinase
MNKILSPLLLLLLIILAFISFEFQSSSRQKLEKDLKKEHLARGQYYCQQIIREIEFLPTLDKQFLNFLEKLDQLQPNELIALDLKIAEDYLHIWKHPDFENTKTNSEKFACIKSEEFIYKNHKCFIYVFLQPSAAMKTLHNLQTLNEKLTMLLITLVFVSALLTIFMLYTKHKKDQRRIHEQMRHKEFSNQNEIHKREKDAEVLRTQMREKEQQLRHADKMNSLGTLASSMAHEINNPNSYISLNAETLDKAWRDVLDIINNQINEETKIAGIPYKLMRDRIPTLTQAIKEGSERIKNIVADLKHFSGLEKTKDEQKSIVNLKNVINSSMRLTTTFMNKYTDHLTVENEADLFILGYEQRLEQVIVNLLLNAAQSLPSKDKKVKLKAYLDKNEVKLEISDEGCGISEDNQKKIFEPFFTTKTDSGGTGLGLSISFGIIQDMGGQIKVESKIDQGTTFTVILPVHQSK